MRTTSLLPTAKIGVLLVTLVGALVIGLGPVSSATDDNEKITLSMATMLRSARAVISDKQKHINDAAIGDKGLSGAVAVAAAKANYKKASGVDADSVDPASLEGQLLAALTEAIAAVMDEAQPLINEKGVGLKGFLPAIFARRVTEEFRTRKGTIADIRLTAPKAYVRNRANRPDDWETDVIENTFKSDSHPKGQHVAVMGERKGKAAYRLILPEYYKQSCLACHGGPKAGRFYCSFGGRGSGAG